MSNPAKDEFDALVSSQGTHPALHHPEDSSSSDDGDTEAADDTTLVPSINQSTAKSTSSLRSSNLADRDSSGEDSDAEQGLTRRKSTPYYIPSKHGYDANTGPKGVIADAKAFENERRMGNKKTYVRTEHLVLPKMQRLGLGEGRGAEESRRRSRRSGMEEERREEEDEEDEDEEFVRRWREKRGGELRGERARSAPMPSSGGRRGRYGTLKIVDAMGFLEAVEGQFAATVVVVYVFDDLLPISDAFQVHLETLAAKYADVKFIALHYEEAEMEHTGVPALLAYRNHEQFASLIPLHEMVPATQNVMMSLEDAMRSRGIL